MDRSQLAQVAMQRSRVLFSAPEVATAYDTLAEQIGSKLGQANPVVVAVLTGAMVTVVELLKRFTFPCQLDYVHVTRYADAVQGGSLQWLRSPNSSLANRHVLLVDDILDEGITIAALKASLFAAGVASLHTAVLLAKDSADRDVDVDFVGLRARCGYVFGCGMDYRGYWRGLADIRVVED